MGQRLGARLEDGIEAIETEDRTRAEIIAEMGQEAGISAGTVNEILRGEIDCPPLARLRAFARVLDLSVDSLVSAAEADGCEYDADGEPRSCPRRGERRGGRLVERRYHFDERSFGLEERQDGSRLLTGHPAVFHSLSEDLFGFRERILPGAFGKTIREGDVRGLFNHDPNIVLGRTRSGTLRLREDDIGLHMEDDIPDTGLVRDMVISPMKRGDVTGGSFSFEAVKDRMVTEDGIPTRELIEVRAFDVGPVTFPAYPATDVQARVDPTVCVRAALMREDPRPDARTILVALRGMGLTDRELRSTVANVLEMLDRGPESRQPSTRHRVALLRRKLDLLELES